MHIRSATLEDVAEISRVMKSLDFPEFTPSDPSDISKRLQDQQGFIAEENDLVVGAMILEMCEQSCEMYALVADQRRQGVGRALLSHAERLCRERGIPKIWCWSMERYHAEGFYRKMGFTEVHLLQKQWFGQDCYFFGKILSWR